MNRLSRYVLALGLGLSGLGLCLTARPLLAQTGVGHAERSRR
jgi:hypothetical protein